MHVKIVTAQNGTDLSNIQVFRNVSKHLRMQNMV